MQIHVYMNTDILELKSLDIFKLISSKLQIMFFGTEGLTCPTKQGTMSKKLDGENQGNIQWMAECCHSFAPYWPHNHKKQ